MKSKCGPGVLLLAAVLTAIGVGFLPLNTAAAGILLLLAGGPTTHRATLTEPYDGRTYGNLPTDTSGLENGLRKETSSLIASNIVTNSEETSYNLTSTVTKIHSAATPSGDIFSTEIPDTSWITVGQSTAIDSPDVSPGTGRVTGPELTNHTNSSANPSSTAKSSVTLNVTTAAMETDKAVCIRPTGMTDAEVLAIVVGAVFITILLSALLYQLSVFMKKKKKKRESSVYVIENQLHKYDFEANGLQTETKL
ncbi:uncharacterized protein LOC142108949 [Mixophyes fleayi]|uniref:uncharacterized protein LOC142108949 n=1 Tax=Mixophyes fleayi TaxID=3061075 RepID=UPI003F4E2AA9